MAEVRQPSRILKRRTANGPATRTNSQGVPAYFVGAYIPEDLHKSLIEDAAENERTVSAQIIFLLKTHYLKPHASQGSGAHGAAGDPSTGFGLVSS